jgi:pilus assembly protein CpaB
MNRTRMLMLASVALVLSVIVTFLTYRLLRQRLQPPDEMTTIVVATQRLALGQRLATEDVRVAPWPKSALIPGSSADPSVFVGRGVIQPIEANEPILETKLAPKDAGAGLTTTIPEGMRAVSIRVNDVIGVAGFVVPGSHVDVILSGSPAQGGANDVAKIILENVQVLAAGQNIDQDINGKPQTVQVVTLLVTPEDSQKMALASHEGSLQLALRNPLDKDTPNPPLMQRAALYTGGVAAVPIPTAPTTPPEPRVRRVVVAAPPPPPPPPPPPAPVEQKKLQVQLIQGNASQTLTFDQQEQQGQPPQQ